MSGALVFKSVLMKFSQPSLLLSSAVTEPHASFSNAISYVAVTTTSQVVDVAVFSVVSNLLMQSLRCTQSLSTSYTVAKPAKVELSVVTGWTICSVSYSQSFKAVQTVLLNSVGADSM